MIVMVFSMQVMASSGSGSFTVPVGSRFFVAKSDISRTGSYSYIKVKAESVIPTSEGVSDTYTKCKAKLFLNGSVRSDEKVLTEGTQYKLYIYEGYLHERYVDLAFAGNNPNYDAKIFYTYDGL